MAMMPISACGIYKYCTLSSINSQAFFIIVKCGVLSTAIKSIKCYGTDLVLTDVLKDTRTLVSLPKSY